MWAKFKQTRYLTDKAILGEMCEVHVTYVADVDKGQQLKRSRDHLSHCV